MKKNQQQTEMTAAEFISVVRAIEVTVTSPADVNTLGRLDTLEQTAGT